MNGAPNGPPKKGGGNALTRQARRGSCEADPHVYSCPYFALPIHVLIHSLYIRHTNYSASLMKGWKRRPQLAAAVLGLVLLMAGVLAAIPLLSLGPAGDEGMSVEATEDGFTFGAAGDFGFDGEAQTTMANAAGLDFFFALGDFSYDETTEENWCNTFESYVGDGRVILVVGNHDSGESGGGNINEYIKYCDFGLGVPLTGDYGKEYYFDYPATNPLARFIGTACGLEMAHDGEGFWVCVPGDEHYEFVKNAIDDAQSIGIPWIIVGAHNPCISSSNKDCDLGQEFFDLLLAEKVDLALLADDHDYQRSKQLTCATNDDYRPECVVDNDNWYTKGAGTVNVINGAAGQPLATVRRDTTDWRYIAMNNGDSWGQMQYEVSATTIHAKWVTSAGEFDDAFTISSESEPQPWPGPTDTWQGRYFDNWDFTDLKLNRTDAAIDFDWGAGSPDAAIDPSTFSARWDGAWSFEGGIYTFSMTTDDGMRVWLDGEPLFDEFFSQSPTTYTVETEVNGGDHHIRVEYYEKGGDAVAGFSWTLDSADPPPEEPPTAAFTYSPEWGRPGVDLTFDASASSSNGTPEYRWDWEDDGTWDAEWMSDAVLEHAYADAGTYTVRLEVRDTSSGLTDSATDQVPVDGGTPSTSHELDGTWNDDGYYTSPVQVTLTATDDLSGVASIEYRLDGGPWGTYAGPFNVTGNATHALEFYSTDRAGNVEEIQGVTIPIGGPTPPEEPPQSHLALEGASGSGGWYVSSVTVSLSASSPSGLTVTLTFRLDGGAWQSYEGPFQLDDGRHQLEYFASDSRGAEESTRSADIWVDTQAPLIHQVTPSDVVTATEVTIQWTATDDVSGIARYEISVDGGPWTDVGPESAFRLQLEAGTHHVAIKIVDQAGNLAVSGTTFVVDPDGSDPADPNLLFGMLPAVLVLATILGIILVAVVILLRRQRDEA